MVRSSFATKVPTKALGRDVAAMPGSDGGTRAGVRRPGRGSPSGAPAGHELEGIIYTEKEVSGFKRNLGSESGRPGCGGGTESECGVLGLCSQVNSEDRGSNESFLK